MATGSPTMKWAILGDECEIVGGGTPLRSEPSYFGGDVPWATPTDVTALKTGIFLERTKENITNAGLNRSSAKLLPKGTVLLTSRATIGFTAIAATSMATNQGFANFICGPSVLPEFLAHWLPTQRSKMLQLAGGTTFKEISKGTLKQMRFPLPPLEEQRRIVDILNHAASIRRLRDKARAKVRELVPALFVEMFGDPATNPKGWSAQPLCEVIEGVEGGKNILAGDEGASKFRILKISAVTSGEFRPEENKPAPADYQPRPSHFVRKGDVLFSRANTVDLVGATALVTGVHDNLLLPDKLWRFCWRPASLVLPYYMLHFFKQSHTRAALSLMATGTSDSMRNISQAKLMTLPVLVPPLALQQQFADRVAEIEATAALSDKAAAAAEQLTQSLLSQVFGHDSCRQSGDA